MISSPRRSSRSPTFGAGVFPSFDAPKADAHGKAAGARRVNTPVSARDLGRTHLITTLSSDRMHTLPTGPTVPTDPPPSYAGRGTPPSPRASPGSDPELAADLGGDRLGGRGDVDPQGV